MWGGGGGGRGYFTVLRPQQIRMQIVKLNHQHDGVVKMVHFNIEYNVWYAIDFGRFTGCCSRLVIKKSLPFSYVG